MILIIFVFIFLAVFFLVLAFIPTPEEAVLSARLERLRRKRRIEIASTVIKIFTPIAGIVNTLITRILPQGYISNLERKLIIAGYRQVSVEEVIKEKISSGMAISIMFFIVVFIIFSPPIFILFVWAVIFFVIGFFLKDINLYYEIKNRHASIQKDLADVLDQLTTAVRAGLGFNAALQYVVDSMHPSPLREELSLLLSELRLGRKRTEALLDVADRTEHPDLSLVAITIAHGEEIGAPITDTLSSLAEEIRRKRWDYAEEKAAKAPVLIVIPTILLILPTLFIILFGPIILNYLLRGGM